MSNGLCECGCGELAPVARYSSKTRGHVAGQPMRFVYGHVNRGRVWSPVSIERRRQRLIGHVVTMATRRKIARHHKRAGIRPSADAARKGNENRGTGSASPAWKGGRSLLNGYVAVYAKDHPRAHRSGYVYEHILIAERTLGREVARGQVVHHLDGNKRNNAPENLAVLESQAEHVRVHKRMGDLR